MAEHTGAVCVCLTAGLSDALTRLILATAPSTHTLQQVYQATTLRIANLDPPGVPLPDQVEVVNNAIALFNEIFIGAIASAGIVHTAARPAPACRRRRRRSASIAPDSRREQG